MMRIMVNAWGPNSAAYTGHSMTLYRDPKVKWGGAEIGGIRISHMTGISGAMTMALSESKAVRKMFKVLPLVTERATSPAATGSSPAWYSAWWWWKPPSVRAA
jgi:hypothetical protein